MWLSGLLSGLFVLSVDVAVRAFCLLSGLFFVDGTYGFRVTICKARVVIAPRGGNLDRFRRQPSNGLGGNLHRNTHGLSVGDLPDSL